MASEASASSSSSSIFASSVSASMPTASASASASASSENNGYDRLRELNQTAHSGKGLKSQEGSQWLPLESNHDLLNSFAKMCKQIS